MATNHKVNPFYIEEEDENGNWSFEDEDIYEREGLLGPSEDSTASRVATLHQPSSSRPGLLAAFSALVLIIFVFLTLTSPESSEKIPHMGETPTMVDNSTVSPSITPVIPTEEGDQDSHRNVTFAPKNGENLP